MKRSAINGKIKEAERFFAAHHFLLPEWAYWHPRDWDNRGAAVREIVEHRLGWDITDFGSGDFPRVGLLLFTIRNGRPGAGGKPYAEKIMLVEEGQVTPLHFHRIKMEDIINRGGGDLVMQVRMSDEREALSPASFDVSLDGIARTCRAGEEIVLRPGQSVCLPPRLYHAFWGRAGGGRVLVGEVSSVNDDQTDNRFHEPVGRFPRIEEDEPPHRLLITDYQAPL